MLTTLRISGLAVVDAVEVQFGPGLNVLTGETGAGKSILVNALHLVLGGRTTADVLREGADEAVVEALFELPPDHPAWERLGLAGSPPSESKGPGRPEEQEGPRPTRELLVRRVVSRSGRGRASVNGALCTVSMLEAGLRGLVDISGQHEHVSLLDPAVHLEMLDAYAGAPRQAPGERDPQPDALRQAQGERDPQLDALRQAQGERGAQFDALRQAQGERGAQFDEDPLRGGGHPLLGRYREAYGALAALVRERDTLAADEGERARRADYLAFQLRELDAAGARPGELEALEGDRRVLASAEKLREAAHGAEGLVYGEEGSASERVGQAVRSLVDAAAVDPRLGTPLGLLRSAAVELEEAGRELGRYAEAVGGDPDRLSAVEDRVELLRALARKHGGTLEAALARRDAMREELAGLANGGERLEELAKQIAGRGAEALRLADELTRLRKDAARRFAAAVQRELDGLAMGRCQIEVALLPPEGGVEIEGRRLAPAGAEGAELLIAPNLGEPARPLARIASGGELSRFLLAVKRVLARRDPVATYVFDEVDAGIGGAVAEAMGRVLADVSRGRQVLCITHLPQVAAFADRHHRVEKAVSGRRTHTAVALLASEEERRREVARMMAGLTVTASALEHAAALIAAARLPPAAVKQGRRAAPGRSAARMARRDAG
jgi:DNA repair protein RecN (Recombination protein N)